MPEDLSTLLADLGGTPPEAAPITDPVVDSTVADPAPQDSDPEGGVVNKPIEGDEGSKAPEQTPEPDAMSKAFAAMRVQTSKYTKFFKQLEENTGTSEDQIMEALLTQATQAKAEKENVSPEILTKLREQDDKLKAYEEREREKDLMLGLDTLQREFKLESKDLEQFVKDSIAKNIDLYNSKMDYKTIYRALYHDKLVKDAVEEARQEFIKTQVKAEKATVPVNSTGQKSDKEPTAINTMSDLDSLLNSVMKK